MKRLVDIKERDVQVAVINGQQLAKKQLYMCCPTCAKVLMEFNVGLTYSQVIKYISDELNQEVKHCPYCAQELAYPYILDYKDVIK